MRPFLVCTAIYLLGAALRLAFVFQTLDVPAYRSPAPGLDIDIYWRAAEQIRGGLATRPSFEIMMASAPLYVFWLSLTQSLLGSSMELHRIASALFFPFTAVVAYRASFRAFADQYAALLSALLLACLPSLVFFDTMLMKVSLELLLLALLVYTALGLSPEASPRAGLLRALWIGVLLALLFGSQQNTFLYTVALLVYLLSRRDFPMRRRILFGAVISGVIAISVGVFSQRDRLLDLGQPSFLPQSGINIRVGNHDGASGSFSELPDVPATPAGYAFVARMDAEVRHGRWLTPGEANALLMREAAGFVWGQPGRAGELLLRKLELFFNDFEPSGVHFFEHVVRSVPFLGWLPSSFGVLLLLAAWGLFDVRWRRRWEPARLLLLLLGAALTANLLAFVSWRLRLHAVLPLALLAGPGGICAISTLRAWAARAPGAGRRLALLAGTGATVGALVFHTPETPEQISDLFEVAQHNARWAWSGQAVEQKLDSTGRPEDWTIEEAITRARLLVSVQRHTEAFQLLRDLVERRKVRGYWPHKLYLTYLVWSGDADAAGRLVARIRETNPKLLERLLSQSDRLLREHLAVVVIPALGESGEEKLPGQ